MIISPGPNLKVSELWSESLSPEDEQVLESLRVQDWSAFQGQSTVKESLLIAIQAAQARQEPVDHVLLYGPPGLGKTTLSNLIARAMSAKLVISSGMALSKGADLAAILTNLQPRDVLFIDEIHRLKKPLEELLYAAMEDFKLDLIVGQGPSARTVRLDLPPFTLVGATTKFGHLSGPFRDRFGVVHRLSFYSPTELATITIQASKTLNFIVDEASAQEIARRARGTPRVALKLLKRVRDFCQVKHQGQVNPDLVVAALNLHQVDPLGLTDTDHKLLIAMINHHQGGPVGLTTLSALLNEDPITIEEVIEPYLLQIGFLKKTPQGRVVTAGAYRHLKLSPSHHQ